MKIRLDKELADWILPQVRLELEQDDEKQRNDVLLEALSECARSGEAERFVRSDGKVAWRMSQSLRDHLEECRIDDQDDPDDYQ